MKTYMAKLGSSTDHTKNSSCLDKVGNESRNIQSSPDSFQTYIIWIVTQVKWHQCPSNFENSSNHQPRLWPGWKFTDG